MNSAEAVIRCRRLFFRGFPALEGREGDPGRGGWASPASADEGIGGGQPGLMGNHGKSAEGRPARPAATDRRNEKGRDAGHRGLSGVTQEMRQRILLNNDIDC
ncbi:hypothetical protein, partial [Stenotrophomonas geniculata]|uniref:hypothetical protein n=1 Tax=Stenotrophomonas geniculata TaxID=86188 RepID=UPI002E7A44DB